MTITTQSSIARQASSCQASHRQASSRQASPYYTEADYMRRIVWIIIHRSHTCLPPSAADGAVAVSAQPTGAVAESALPQGHHFYIDRRGVLHHVVPMGIAGHHTPGFNHHSLSICIEGGLAPDGMPSDYCTPAQWEAFEDILLILRALFPQAQIVGANRMKAPRR